jgi:YD repeat-containing protein
MYIYTGQMATLSWIASNADTVNIDNGIGEVSPYGSIYVSPTKTTTYTITATNPAGSTTDTVTLKVIHINPLPGGSFAKQYEELIPEDAAIEEYDEKRFCIITGFVYTRDETVEKLPLPDVTISLHNHSEYGTARSNEEGRFAIPADGGGIYTVVYEKEGYIQAQRQVKTSWSEVVLTKDDPVLIQKDPKTTQVVFDGNPDTIIIHESTPVIDERGTRSCTLVFTGDNKAYTSDGRQLATITTSVTEYATPDSMPAILPPYTQFTYCAEFSVEEAEGVRFEKPVIAYVEDFMGFGAGGIVPVRFYDRDRAVWAPCRNGLIVTLLDTNADGVVDALDADGDGIPDDINYSGSVTDDALGLDDPNRYKPDTTYWRIELEHFSPGDFNWPMFDYPPPGPPCPPVFDTQVPKDCKTNTGSYAEHRSRIFHEDIPIRGTDWTLHYASHRTSGYKYKITIPVTDAMPSCNAISVCVKVTGHRFMESFVPRANEKTEFIWNGLDFLGNEMHGTVSVSVDIIYHYVIGNYMIPVVNRFGDMPPRLLGPEGGLFGWPGSGYYTSKPGEVNFRPVSSGGYDRSVIFPRTLTRKYYINVQRKPKKEEDIAEGWTISAHHRLVRDPVAPSALYKGDGTILKNEKIIKTIAGTGIGGYNGDNIPSTQAQLNGPIAAAIDSEGNLYILQERQKRVRKVDTDGIITTIAGGGSDTRDGIPATEAQFYRPEDIAVDNEGNLYIIDHHSIRKVDTQGIITTIVNRGGKIGYYGDGGPATEAWLCYPTSIACDSNGNIYIADSGNNRVRMVNTNRIISGSRSIRKVSPGGIITTLVNLNLPHISSPNYKIAIDSQDNLYFVHLHESVIKMVNQDGDMVTVAGNGDHNHDGDAGAPLDASFSPMDVAIDPMGDIYIVDWWHERVRKISRSFVFASDTGILVPDDGGIGYVMSPEGYHLSTIDLHTRKTLLSFGYDAQMRLISITDRFGNETTIERDPLGRPCSVTSMAFT